MLPIFERNNPIHMKVLTPASARRHWLSCASWTLILALFCLMAVGQGSQDVRPTDPLPQDSGVLGLKEMLLRLHTTARLMQTTAHPDDEDGGLLTLESRGRGADVLLLTLNRGEGGQNKVGSNLFDVLGVVRTLELTAADRYYGVEQRFTRVADFGFSKSADETFRKWQGHDIPLGDMVRVIRTFRPDVLVARFSGTERDGHGHHQASSILTKEAFRAAADANRFPEQIKEGLPPWQAKKLYIGNVCGFGASSCPSENYTVRLNTGEMSAALGMTYVQFAVNEGLRHQLSQGAGGWSIDAGPHYAFYKLVDSVRPPSTDKEGHEPDLFDGIDTSLVGLAARLGPEENKAPWLKPELEKIQKYVDDSTAAAAHGEATESLLSGLDATNKLIEQVDRSSLSAVSKVEWLAELRTKQQQFEQAANLAAGADLKAWADVPVGSNPDNAFMAVPGQSFNVVAEFSSKRRLEKLNIGLELPGKWKAERIESGAANNSKVTFKVTVPEDAEFTRPYWHRDNPETDAINIIDDPRYLTLPYPPFPVKVRASYEVEGKTGALHSLAMMKYKDSKGDVLERAVAVAPAFSVMLDPGEQVIPVTNGSASTVKVIVSCNLPEASGKLHLDLPANWRSEPSAQSLQFHQTGESQEFQFRVIPASLKEGRAQIRAVVESGGMKYSEGYSVVTRDDLATFYYYQPAIQRVSIVDVKVPKDLKLGYVMGAGDEIPTVLQQLGMDVTLVPAEKLASEDLTRFGTIVLGIRAYDTQKDVAANNKKLLDYVSAGGTLLVQYNASVSDFNSGHFTPYPAELSRARVSVEEAPVQILAPEDSVFHYPNQIAQRDFDGWVQERGLYFMDQWDAHYKPLLACQDPGEELQKGGLLQAQYGKGIYIYTGYAFFRQLPAGVPGAVRLYVNLVSAGHEE